MSKEVPFTAERENGNNRWTDVASVSIGCAVPMVIFGRASIVPFVALPVIIGLCRSDTGFFRIIQEAIRRHRFLMMAVAATISFLVDQQRRIHRPREIAQHLGPYGRHICSRGDAYRLPLSI